MTSTLFRVTLIPIAVLLCFSFGDSNGEVVQKTSLPNRTFWFAPDGKPNGDGSKEHPFRGSVPVFEAVCRKFGGGHTYMFKPGFYKGQLEIPKGCNGTKERPTILKSQVKWKAVVYGAKGWGLFSPCDWVIIDGFEVCTTLGTGITVSGKYATVRNCHVHHNTLQGIGAGTGSIIENNLIEFNGSHVHFHHGVYAGGDGLIVRNNIVRHNSGYGLHLYDNVSNAVVVNNVVYGHSTRAGIVVACSEGGGTNVVANNTIARNKVGIMFFNGNGDVIVNNILWENGTPFSNVTEKLLIEHNLCWPQFNIEKGEHDIEADPRFVAEGDYVFWLRKNSPCIGKGSLKYASETDFWGRPRKKDQPVDLGAFSYRPVLEKKSAREGWHSGYPYRYARKGSATWKGGQPDLWWLPE